MFKLAKERTVLMKDGMPTLKLKKVMFQIFSMYAEHNLEKTVGDVDMDNATINEIMASRLWYRCGIKLTTLDSVYRSNERRCVAFRDFFSLIQKVIADEERENGSAQREKSGPSLATPNFEVWT
jgi:hypothetical protein